MLDFLSSYSVMASLRRTRAEVWRSSQALAFVCFFLALRTGAYIYLLASTNA